MKRFLTMLLTLGLVLSLAIPALAAAEDELTAVTEAVVETLDVSDDYADFSGSFRDGLRPGWYLYWSKEGEDLSVTCTEDGLVTEAYLWRDQGSADRFYGYDAAFPRPTETDARRQAEAWLSRLMGEVERARIDDASAALSSNGAYTFFGRVLKNGLESPITFSLSIGEAGLSHYSRSDSYKGYIGGVPEARTGVGKPEAAPLLKDAAELELYYVSDGDTARLRYVPVGAYTVVDAVSGGAVDMDALYASFGSSYYGPEAPAAAEMATDMGTVSGMGRGLTETELSSIANYADVLPEESLDAALRSIGDLGLADFTLTRCSYTMDADGEITASLRYTCEMTADNLFGYSMDNFWQVLDWGETPTVVKTVTADAKSGTLVSVYTSYPLWERDEARTPEPAAAEAFLRKAAPERFAESALCTLKGYNRGEELTYVRMHDGYFFPENYLSVTLNTATNTVDSYYYRWDDDAAFAASEGIVSGAEAIDAYTDALSVTLGYAAWPEAIDYDDPILYAYADWGYTYAESLRLAYYYSGTDEVSGVDALTGEPIRQDPDGGYLYDDLDGVPERDMIEALASAGVGLAGASFEPEKRLTVEDAARLLLSSAGYRPDGWDDETLKNEAVWEGFVSASDWKPDRELTQEGFIRMLLSASRYGDAAALDGVGYETVARALGMIDGGMPTGAATRADAAVLLYRFMNR